MDGGGFKSGEVGLDLLGLVVGEMQSTRAFEGAFDEFCGTFVENRTDKSFNILESWKRKRG